MERIFLCCWRWLVSMFGCNVILNFQKMQLKDVCLLSISRGWWWWWWWWWWQRWCRGIMMQASIWDGSPWATEGGKIPANYSYEPFSLTIQNIDVTMACTFTRYRRTCGKNQPWDWPLTSEQYEKMVEFRKKHLLYSNLLKCGSAERPCTGLYW